MKPYNFEELIREELDKNASQVMDVDEVSITPMGVHMQELEKNLQNKITAKKNKSKLRVAITFSMIIAFLFLPLMWNTQTVKAFRFSVVKTFIEVKENMLTIKRSSGPSEGLAEHNIKGDKDDIIEQYFTFEEAKNKIPFDFIQASYIPKDFAPKDVQWNQYLGGGHLIIQSYESNNGKFINIVQKFDNSLEFQETINVRKDANLKEININGKEILFISLEDNFTNAIWYDEISSYEIIGNIREDETIKVIKSLD